MNAVEKNVLVHLDVWSNFFRMFMFLFFLFYTVGNICFYDVRMYFTGVEVGHFSHPKSLVFILVTQSHLSIK